MTITVSLAGAFSGQFLSQDYSINAEEALTVHQVLKILKKEFKVPAFSKRGVQTKQIVVMLDGDRIEANALKTAMVDDSSTLTVLQPIQGG